MWIIEKTKNQTWYAKWGKDLKSTERNDPYEFACVIEDAGDGTEVQILDRN